MAKHKKNAIEEAWETIVGWVEAEGPKKGQHGKKANITRHIEKESYVKKHGKKTYRGYND